MTIQHIGLRCIGDLADARVPQRNSGGCVVGHETAAAIAGKDQAACRCQYTAATASVPAFIAMSPFRFACLIVDRGQIAPPEPIWASSFRQVPSSRGDPCP